MIKSTAQISSEWTPVERLAVIADLTAQVKTGLSVSLSGQSLLKTGITPIDIADVNERVLFISAMNKEFLEANRRSILGE